MNGWYSQNAGRQFPIHDTVESGAGGVVVAGPGPLPHRLLLDAFFVVPCASDSSGEHGSGTEIANLSPRSVYLVRVERAAPVTRFVFSLFRDHTARVAAGDPSLACTFEANDSDASGTLLFSDLSLFANGVPPESGEFYGNMGYGVLAVGDLSSLGLADAVYPVYIRASGVDVLGAMVDPECVVYRPAVMQIGLANQVPSGTAIDPLPSVDGAPEPVVSQRRAVEVMRYAVSGVSTFVGGFNVDSELSGSDLSLNGVRGGGLGIACDGVTRIPGNSVPAPFPCSSVIKSVAGVVPPGGDLTIAGGPGVDVATVPGRVVLIINGKEITSG